MEVCAAYVWVSLSDVSVQQRFRLVYSQLAHRLMPAGSLRMGATREDGMMTDWEIASSFRHDTYQKTLGGGCVDL